MKILILGAGVTGSAVAAALASEENDIMVVDNKPLVLDALKERFDIATVAGNAAHPSVLEQAGIDDTDIVIAVTDSDETNMLACLIINALYKRPKTIARVRAIDYFKHPHLFKSKGIPIDHVISPEMIVMEAIRNLIDFPGVQHISEFAGGLIRPIFRQSDRQCVPDRKKNQGHQRTPGGQQDSGGRYFPARQAIAGEWPVYDCCRR